jgi:hypothetical protein
MAIDNFIPEMWERRLMVSLRKQHVYAMLCNRNYQGTIAQQGDTVRINGIGPVTIADYVKNVTQINPETLNGQQGIIRIDQCKYFAFEVDDVDKAQAAGSESILPAGIDEAAYGLADVSDRYIGGLYVNATTITALTPINSLNAYAGLLTLSQALDELNVPREGRRAVLPPWYVSKLVLAKILVENTSNQAFDNGFVGRAAGFDLHVSNNVPTTNNGTEYKILAGTNRGISYAEQINKVEAYRPDNSFSDAVKGLHLYGASVVDPDCLAVLDASILAEP